MQSRPAVASPLFNAGSTTGLSFTPKRGVVTAASARRKQKNRTALPDAERSTTHATRIISPLPKRKAKKSNLRQRNESNKHANRAQALQERLWLLRKFVLPLSFAFRGCGGKIYGLAPESRGEDTEAVGGTSPTDVRSNSPWAVVLPRPLGGTKCSRRFQTAALPTHPVFDPLLTHSFLPLFLHPSLPIPELVPCHRITGKQRNRRLLLEMLERITAEEQQGGCMHAGRGDGVGTDDAGRQGRAARREGGGRQERASGDIIGT